MSKKQEIDLNINTEVSDDEFEYESSDDDNDEEETETENDANLEENNDDDSLENTNEFDKTNYEDSISKSENFNAEMSDTFIDFDDDDNDDEDIFSASLPEKEMKENLIVPNEKRISRNILTKYEKVRLLGTRAKQISDGSKVFVKYDGAKSAMELAELELKHKVIPLKIKRPLPNGLFEIWSINELEILN